MRCPKCDNKERRLISISSLTGKDEDSYSGTALSTAILKQAFADRAAKDGSQVYCSWCGFLVYEDPKE